MQKKFYVKVYDVAGSNLLKTIPVERLLSEPSFKSQVNGGLGVCKYSLNYPFLNFSESQIVKERLVQVWKVDDNSPSGRLIHQGPVMDVDSFTEDGAEGLDVEALGLISLLTYDYYNDGAGSEEVVHTADDPSDIMRAIIDNYQATTGETLISYTASSLPTGAIGTTVNMTITDSTWLEALQLAFEKVPEGWYWFIDRNGVVYLKEYSTTTADHIFTLNKDVVNFHARSTTKGIVNDAENEWSGGTVTSSDATSIAAYRRRKKKTNDTTSDDSSTAQAEADQLIANKKDPENRFTMRVNNQYDIETIEPGHTCKLVNLNDPDSLLPSLMRIASVTYKADYVTLEVESVNTNFADSVESL